MFLFELTSQDGAARTGRLTTAHGSIETPAFVPVATRGATGALSSDDLKQIGAQVLISNSFHLHLQPGEDLIESLGGLHGFTGWNGPLMTDSGGFQIFSLGAGREQGLGKIAPIFPENRLKGGHLKKDPLVRIEEEGAEFISYLDGSRHFFSPEGVMDLQAKLGADIVLVLDECTSPLHDHPYTRAAMERTHRWAERSLEHWHKLAAKKQAVFGIIQGGAYRDLREESAAVIAGLSFDGYGIGGSLGNSRQEMHRVLEWTIPLLPPERPRHLLGIGEVEDVFEIVGRGVDLFDCVAPTRMARTGTVFMKGAERHRLHLLNARFREDPSPIDPDCPCPACRGYSRAFLRHLFAAKEPLAERLAALHNLYFMESLMEEIRKAIREKRWDKVKKTAIIDQRS